MNWIMVLLLANLILLSLLFEQLLLSSNDRSGAGWWSLVFSLIVALMIVAIITYAPDAWKWGQQWLT